MTMCELCKHSEISQGDFVDYGSTTAQLPDTIECHHPDAYEYFNNEGKGCPYFEEMEVDEDAN